MTSDELEARLAAIGFGIIFETIRYDKQGQENCQMVFKALRAVVELHKPFEEFGDASCEACFNSEYSNKDQPYPCDTIQAIEKELG